MPTTKKNKPIAAHLMLAFEGKLNRLNIDDAEEVSGTIEELYGCLDDGVRLRHNELPTEIPLGVRNRMVELTRQRDAIMKEVEAMIEQLDRAAAKAYDKKQAAYERNQPRCEKCHQPLGKKHGKRPAM